MSIDLTQFHAAFFEESLEAIASMEQALLQLDAGAPDPEAINTIFRVAHSVKGGAATFGFGEISSFTHSLENLLDLLRAGRMSVTAGLMEPLLRSVDVMRELLNAQQSGKPVDAQRMADLQLEIEQAAMGSAAEPVASAPSPQAKSTLYRIRLRPLPQLLARRNDPLRLFRELA